MCVQVRFTRAFKGLISPPSEPPGEIMSFGVSPVNYSDSDSDLEKDLFYRSNLLGIIDPSTSDPDHSLLTWEVKIEIRHQASVKQNENQISFVKFSRNYPQGFLNDCASELNICIDKLESVVSNQRT